MPTYDLKNVETGEVKEMIISISKKEEMVASGEWEQVFLDTPRIVTHVGGIFNKTPDSWKDKLKDIKSKTGGNLDDKITKKHGFKKNTIKV